jgi:carboxyl-terminal processing protease
LDRYGREINHQTAEKIMLGYQRQSRIVWAILFGVFLLGGLYAAAQSKAPPPDYTAARPADLRPLPEHPDAQKEVVQRLQREHLHPVAYDDALASRLLDRYLDDLDPSRSFFLQTDIDSFGTYRSTLHSALLKADLDPAFDIFNRFHQRRIQRLEAIITRIENSIEDMDFTQDETLESDRKNAPWARASNELDLLWKKRLKLEVLNLLLAGKSHAEARELLLKRYRNQLRLVGQINSEDVFQVYMNALTRCYDPHTQYFSPRNSENFTISMKLSLEGIGAVLTSEDLYTKIIRLVPGGPADRSKLLNPADRIVGVGQGAESELQDVVGWRLDDVVELIRGPKGTIVRLEVLPAGIEDSGRTRTVAIERATVKLEDQAARKKIVSALRDGRTWSIGVIELPTFYLDFQALQAGDPDYKSTAKDIERLLRECSEKNIDGLILDLRGNSGGSLQEAVDLTGKFLRYGPVVQVRSARNRLEDHSDHDHRISYRGPLLVLVNRLSASAAEIVAGALQDYGRAVIVGSQTFGKGTVQSLVPLAHGQLKATGAEFYRVSGEGTQHRGVVPDITYPCLIDPAEIGESALPDAFPWSTIDDVMFPAYSDLAQIRTRLKKLHDRRMRDDPDHRYLIGLTEHMRALRARTSISLLRTQREREQAELEQIRLSLENSLREAKNLPLLASYAELEKTLSSDNATDVSDPMLDEAVHILMDFINLQAPPQRSNRSYSPTDTTHPHAEPLPCALHAQADAL